MPARSVDHLLAEAVHRLRCLFEWASRIALGIVAVVPKAISPLEGMARLHFQAEHAECRGNDDEVRFTGDLPQVVSNVERMENDPVLCASAHP